MSDPHFAGEPSAHDGDDRGTVQRVAPVDVGIVSNRHRARGPQRRHDAPRPAGDQSSRFAIGPRDALADPRNDEAPAPAPPRTAMSTEAPTARRSSGPIPHDEAYSDGIEASPEFSVEQGAQDESVSCIRCEQDGRTCKACVQRRHRAWELVEREGRTIDEAAAVMRLPVARVCMLVAHERDRLEVVGYRLNSIPTERARAFLQCEIERDPTLTRAEVAHRMNMSQADFDHQFGYAGVKKANGAKQQRVGIPLASSLALALGHAPHDLDGC